MFISRFTDSWVAATIIGWVVGIPCVLLITAGAGAAGLSAQFGIGLGMGLSIGFFQWRRARRSFSASRWWVWSSAIGLATPFAVCDLAGYHVDGGNLIVPTAVGGLLAGLGQSRLLGVRTLEKCVWTVTTVIAWAAAAAATLLFTIHGHPSSGLQLLRQLLALVSGGVIVGMVTSPVLAWLHGTNPQSS